MAPTKEVVVGPRRTWMIVLGIIALVLAVPLLIGGVAIAAIFGPDGTFESGDERIDTQTRALVSAVADISGGAPIDRGDIRVVIDLEGAGEKPIFIGVGRAADVTAYLDNVDVERIDDIDFGPFRYTKTRIQGLRVPDPPGSETFWVAMVEGTGRQELEWDLRSGTFQVVIMNADASPVIDVTGSIGVHVPWIFPVALGLVVAGVLLLVAGILLVVFGAKRRPLPEGQAPPIGYAPVPAPGQPGYGPVQTWDPTVPPSPPAPQPEPTPASTLKPGDPLPPPPPPS